MTDEHCSNLQMAHSVSGAPQRCTAETSPAAPPSNSFGFRGDGSESDTSRRRKMAVHCLFFLFGMGSWTLVNALWAELPIILHQSPEGNQIASRLSVAIQVANVAPFIFMVCDRRLCGCCAAHVTFESCAYIHTCTSEHVSTKYSHPRIFMLSHNTIYTHLHIHSKYYAYIVVLPLYTADIRCCSLYIVTQVGGFLGMRVRQLILSYQKRKEKFRLLGSCLFESFFPPCWLS